MERWHEIPESITHVLEFSGKMVSFCGKKEAYVEVLQAREQEHGKDKETMSEALASNLTKTITNTAPLVKETSLPDEVLVEMNHVNVTWGDNTVLKDLNWKLKKGEHWLVRGPNGSGKTTFLELITGDNPQVYCNDVRLFGIRRGSG